MKKSHFISLLLGVIGTLGLGIGMCMCLLPEWNMFHEGIIVGCSGLLILFIMIMVYRKLEHKAPIQITLKTIWMILLVIIGVLGLGIGMCLTMVYDQIILGIVIGVVGIFVLLWTIPLGRGFTDND